MATQALDALYAIAQERNTKLHLHRDRGARQWVATIGDDSAPALTANGAVRALADKLAPRPVPRLCQQEDTHG